jgi:hypothetical protein
MLKLTLSAQILLALLLQGTLSNGAVPQPTPTPTPPYVPAGRTSDPKSHTPLAVPELGPIVDGLAIGLVPSARYRVGRSVFVSVYFRNSNDRPLFVHHLSGVSFEVQGPPSGFTSHTYAFDDGWGRSVVDDQIRIIPGDSMPNAFSVTSTYSFATPGIYQIRAHLKIANTNLVVSSPWVSITVN